MSEAVSAVIRPDFVSMLEIGGCWLRASPEEPAVIPVIGGELVFTVWRTECARGFSPMPALCRAVIKNGVLAESSAPAVDWGGVIELMPRTVLIETERPVRQVLDSARFRMGERTARAELVLDGGVRLELLRDGAAPLSFGLGSGNRGSLRVIDFGFARCLAAHIFRDGGEGLAIVSPEGVLVLNAEGERADVVDGVPTRIESLGTKRGHELRTRWETLGGVFVPKEDPPGFYTHEPFPLEGEAEKAAALFEETALGRDVSELMTGSLAEAAGEGGLRDYAGEFSRVLLFPLEEPPGAVTVGLVRKEEGAVTRPDRFRVSFSDGLADDVAEL